MPHQPGDVCLIRPAIAHVDLKGVPVDAARPIDLGGREAHTLQDGTTVHGSSPARIHDDGEVNGIRSSAARCERQFRHSEAGATG
jgi:hypothetical protein